MKDFLLIQFNKQNRIKTYLILGLFSLVCFFILSTNLFTSICVTSVAFIKHQPSDFSVWESRFTIYRFYFIGIAISFWIISFIYYKKDFFKLIQNRYTSFFTKNKNNTFIIAGVFVLGITLRFLVSKIGFNYDFESWTVVGKIAAHGGNVYEVTNRYNYGPIFSIILGYLYSISQGNPLLFRYLIIGILTLADIGIAYYILKNYGLYIMILFFLNPISIIITGYHNQFDNITILLGLYAILFLEKSNQNFESKLNIKYTIFSILFLSLSLITKHVLFLLPLWILFQSHISITKRFAFASIPVIVFLMSFIPYISGDSHGIITNVFKYESHNNFPLLLHRFIYSLTTNIQVYYRIIFALFMIFIGYINRHKSFKDIYLIYLISLICFSSAIANQYLVIPLLAICIMGGKFKYLYFFFISAYLLLHRSGIGLLKKMNIENQTIHDFLGSFINNGYTFAVFILLAIIIQQSLKKELTIQTQV